MKDVVAVRPDWGAAHVDLGRVLAARGELDPAAASLQKGLELDAKDAEGHLALGRILLGRKDYAPAWRHAREAERLGHSGARVLLADLAGESKEPGREEPPTAKTEEPPAKKTEPAPAKKTKSGRR